MHMSQASRPTVSEPGDLDRSHFEQARSHQPRAHKMRRTFYGWRVVNAAFVLAVLGLGFGFYGPPVFLHAVRDARGWSLPLISAAVTVHFLIGSIVTANLPALYQRFGV